MSHKIIKSGYEAYFKSKSMTDGYDSLDFQLNEDVSYYGHIDVSPLHKRFVQAYGIPTSTEPEHKHYQALWAIWEEKLYLLHVNALINNQKLSSYDLVPESPDDFILHNYTMFSGTLKLDILFINLASPNIAFVDCESILLHIKNGTLMNHVFNPNMIKM